MYWTHCHKPLLGDGEKKTAELNGRNPAGRALQKISCSAMMLEKTKDDWRRKNRLQSLIVEIDMS